MRLGKERGCRGQNPQIVKLIGRSWGFSLGKPGGMGRGKGIGAKAGPIVFYGAQKGMRWYERGGHKLGARRVRSEAGS